MGIRVIRVDGTASDWGWTFVREFVITGLVFEVAANTVSFGIACIIGLVWTFWDTDHQTLHDKIVKAIVVDDRVLRSRPQDALVEAA